MVLNAQDQMDNVIVIQAILDISVTFVLACTIIVPPAHVMVRNNIFEYLFINIKRDNPQKH